jgi:hypothetical protein
MSKGYECVQGQHGSWVESQHWSVGGERLPVEFPDVSAPHRLPAASRQGQTVSGGGLLGLCDRVQTEWLSGGPASAFAVSVWPLDWSVGSAGGGYSAIPRLTVGRPRSQAT